MDKSFGTSEFHGQTTLHPIGFVVLLVCGLLVLILPRRYAVFPVLVTACFVAPAQRVVVFGADFDLLRLLALAGLVRIASRSEYKTVKLVALDIFVILFLVSGTTFYTISHGTAEALVNRIGWMFDGAGMYLFFRCVFRDWADLESLGWSLAILAFPILFSFIIERMTGRNLFAFLGGVPEITKIREGRMRCQGAFAHPILAGTFWAVCIPLMLIPFASGKRFRILLLLAIGAALGIIFLCASSGPVVATLAAVVVLCFFPFRRYSRAFLLASFALLVVLHFTMNKPVWHLVSRIDVVGGSTGFHRYQLIDRFINGYDRWLWIGTPDASFLMDFRGIADVTNQYILEGLRGGIVTLMFFNTIILVALFGGLRTVDAVLFDRSKSVAVWCVVATLVIHALSFISVSYFGQITILWSLTLSLLGCLAEWGADEVADDSAIADYTLDE